MKILNRGNSSVAIISAVAVWLITTAGNAVPINASATPSVMGFDLLQGNGSNFTITVGNSINSVAVSVDPTRSPVANFVSGDDLDFITGATAGNAAPGCFVAIGLRVLNPGDSCGIGVTFGTGDPRSPDPNIDFGLWNLVTRVTLTEVGNPTNRVDLFP